MQFKEILENSYKDFHAKGLHYLCLQRTELVTVKAYFFEGDVTQAPEIVVPHNHRYDFLTEVIEGRLTDYTYYEIIPPGANRDTRLYNKFDFFTPLNGGTGFKWKKPVLLQKNYPVIIKPGERLFRNAETIHTISVKPDTILLLTQHKDRNPINIPSQAYSDADRELFPNTAGLYDSMDADSAIGYLKLLQEYNVPLGHIRDGRRFPYRN